MSKGQVEKTRVWMLGLEESISTNNVEAYLFEVCKVFKLRIRAWKQFSGAGRLNISGILVYMRLNFTHFALYTQGIENRFPSLLVFLLQLKKCANLLLKYFNWNRIILLPLDHPSRPSQLYLPSTSSHTTTQVHSPFTFPCIFCICVNTTNMYILLDDDHQAKIGYW